MFYNKTMLIFFNWMLKE